MRGRRLSLDTNILVYAMDRDAGKRDDLALQIVDRAVDSDCVLTLQSLCEFYAAVTGKGKMPQKEAAAQIHDWLELFPVASATPKSFTKALKAVKEHGLSFWDAMIWAVAAEAGVALLLSEDFQHTRVLEGVEFYNPFGMDDPLARVFNSLLRP
ncbi:MAG: PIN domain-containing protein [Syntrophobacteraceae bacterium]